MKVHITASFDQPFLEAVDRTCKKLGTDRSEFLCRCALFVMTRREDVVPPLPRTIDPGAKTYVDERFPT